MDCVHKVRPGNRQFDTFCVQPEVPSLGVSREAKSLDDRVQIRCELDRLGPPSRFRTGNWKASRARMQTATPQAPTLTVGVGVMIEGCHVDQGLSTAKIQFTSDDWSTVPQVAGDLRTPDQDSYFVE